MLDRRTFLGAAAAAAASALAIPADAKSWAAHPPKGFTRMSLPGRVVRVHKPGSLDRYAPKADAARIMLERALTELTGKSNLREALAMFVHPDDKVAIKPNGIAGNKTMKMAANKELILELTRGLVAVGVKPKNITIYEQYPDFLYATRCIVDKQSLKLAPEFPKGVVTAVHKNKDAVMDSITVDGVATKYVRPFTEASVVINVAQLKDHSICGYTGAMKNITHGSNINPHDFHEHNASPQIARLYSQEVVKSRVALHIKDAYQVIYEGGPMDNPRRRLPHEAIYVATDPVALDVIGWKLVERLRKDNGLPSLAEAGRTPAYLRVAGELGLGTYDDKRIRLRDVSL